MFKVSPSTPSKDYETAASGLALVGAFTLVFGLFPFLNPTQFKFMLGQKWLFRCYLCIPISLLFIAFGLVLTRKAQRLKKEEELLRLENAPASDFISVSIDPPSKPTPPDNNPYSPPNHGS